jgi:hypothetical protein
MRIQTPTLRYRLATCALVLGIVALAAGPAAGGESWESRTARAVEHDP